VSGHVCVSFYLILDYMWIIKILCSISKLHVFPATIAGRDSHLNHQKKKTHKKKNSLKDDVPGLRKILIFLDWVAILKSGDLVIRGVNRTFIVLCIMWSGLRSLVRRQHR